MVAGRGDWPADTGGRTGRAGKKKGYFKIRPSQDGKWRGEGGILKRQFLDDKPQTQTTGQLYCGIYSPT